MVEYKGPEIQGRCDMFLALAQKSSGILILINRIYERGSKLFQNRAFGRFIGKINASSIFGVPLKT